MLGSVDATKQKADGGKVNFRILVTPYSELGGARTKSARHRLIWSLSISSVFLIIVIYLPTEVTDCFYCWPIVSTHCVGIFFTVMESTTNQHDSPLTSLLVGGLCASYRSPL